jgi:DNA polymerase-4
MGRVMREVLHIDMNSYFATVEQQANPKLRGKPVAVLGSKAKRTIIVAASIEAKKYGVKTGTAMVDAKILCPQIIMVCGEPRKYSHVTKKFIDIFETYTDKVEIFSIDEAFLDITRTSHLFGGAEKLAKEIKKRIRQEIGDWISCSIGVGPNKFLAKLGSDLVKPDGLVVITDKNKDEILLKLPIKDFCGIGRRILIRLDLLGIRTAAGLRQCPENLLTKEFGLVEGRKLKQIAYGFDESPVTSWRDQDPAKSFSCSRTLNRDVVRKEEIKHQVLFLLEKVAKKLREDGYWAKEVGLWLRFKDFSGFGKTKQIGKWSQDGLGMYQEVVKILDGVELKQPVRAIGVYAGKVQLSKNVSHSFLVEDRQIEKILAVMDAVNNRFGEDVVTRAKLSGVKLKEIVSGMGRKKF